MTSLHFVATKSEETLTVEIIKYIHEEYTARGFAGIKIPCVGLRIFAWARYQNGKKLPQPLPFTTLLKGDHVDEFLNGIRTLQFKG